MCLTLGGEGEKKKFDPSRMKNSTSGRLKKSRTDTGGVIDEKSLGLERTEKGGDKAKKSKKVRTKAWFDELKGLMKEDELETANSEKERQRIRDS